MATSPSATAHLSGAEIGDFVQLNGLKSELDSSYNGLIGTLQGVHKDGSYIVKVDMPGFAGNAKMDFTEVKVKATEMRPYHQGKDEEEEEEFPQYIQDPVTFKAAHPSGAEIGDCVQLHGFKSQAFMSYNGLIGTLQEVHKDGSSIVNVDMPGCTGLTEVRVKGPELRPYQRGSDKDDEDMTAYWLLANMTHYVGARVQIDGLAGRASKFNGKVGTITEILVTGHRLVDLPGCANPVVLPSSLVTLATKEDGDDDAESTNEDGSGSTGGEGGSGGSTGGAEGSGGSGRGDDSGRDYVPNANEPYYLTASQMQSVGK